MLAASDRARSDNYPGQSLSRQPVHSAYVPANAFQPDLAVDWGREALRTLADCAPSAAEFGAAMGVPDDLAATVRERVMAKLSAEPVEDLRLDF
jgi:hypothetical protein